MRFIPNMNVFLPPRSRTRFLGQLGITKSIAIRN